MKHTTHLVVRLKWITETFLYKLLLKQHIINYTTYTENMFFYSFTNYSSFIILDIEYLRFLKVGFRRRSCALKTNKRERRTNKNVCVCVCKKAKQKNVFNKERVSFIEISSLLNLNHLLYDRRPYNHRVQTIQRKYM